ncbi:hypothetical protein HGRIS_011632 [Hohenbuehelia grisea]|uniref:Ribophorin II n=1 Tax=Hohenbuehelia grisea TaxID=104357 RepID=A0ABR3JX21_9AGAR
MLLPTTLILLASLVQAATLTLKNSRFNITSKDATELRAEPLSVTEKLSSPLKLDRTDILRLTFQVVEKDNGNNVQPHQAFLRFYDETTDEEGIQPVRVSNTGKGKFELNMAKPPTSLPPTGSAPLRVSLLIGSFVHSPLKVELFDLHVPASHPPAQHTEEASYHPLPPLGHTFRPEQKLPPRIISASFTGLALAPWLVPLVLWGKVAPSTPRLFSPHILPFVTTLALFEGLLFWYWIDLRLGQVLLYGGILALPTVFAGKHALASIGERRLGLARK